MSMDLKEFIKTKFSDFNPSEDISVNDPINCIPEIRYYTRMINILIFRRDIEGIRFLLEHGTDPNLTDCNGNTPLIHACGGTYAYPNIIQLLLDYGADPDIKSFNGTTCIDMLHQGKNDPYVYLILRRHEMKRIISNNKDKSVIFSCIDLVLNH